MQGLDQATMLKIIKELEDKNNQIPMEASPLPDMTPEKAMELDKVLQVPNSRNPASSDMEAEALEEFAPKGSYVAQPNGLGQQTSPDITGMKSSQDNPEEQRLSKLRAMFQR